MQKPSREQVEFTIIGVTLLVSIALALFRN